MPLSIMMGIVLELLQREKVTALFLASKFEISIRSIYRCVDSLSCAGFPVITQLGRSGGISIDPRFVLKNLHLSREEMNTLVTLCEKARPAERLLSEKLKYTVMNNYSQ